LTLAAVAFGAGAMIAMSRGWGEAITIIDIVNGTDQAVSMVTVQFDTCGYRGSIQAGALAPNASTLVRYMVCGEGGQTVTAQFADGTLLKSAAYVESGYRVTERYRGMSFPSTPIWGCDEDPLADYQSYVFGHRSNGAPVRNEAAESGSHRCAKKFVGRLPAGCVIRRGQSGRR